MVEYPEDREERTVRYGGKPALCAPRLEVPSPDNQTLYILETNGETSIRMKK